MRKTPLKRKRPINRVSKKQQGKLLVYWRKRNQFLASHPFCQACEKLGNEGQLPSRDIHHTRGRGPYLNDERTWLAVCRMCHDEIHRSANKSRTLNLLK